MEGGGRVGRERVRLNGEVAGGEALLVHEFDVLLNVGADYFLAVRGDQIAGPLAEHEVGLNVSPGYGETNKKIVVGVHGHLDPVVKVAVGRLLIDRFHSCFRVCHPSQAQKTKQFK